MKFDGALIKEQGVAFAIVVVKPPAVANQGSIRETQNSFRPVFPGVPIVLMVQDHRGTPTYYGRTDIVNFLASISLSRIPWKTYTLT